MEGAWAHQASVSDLPLYDIFVPQKVAVLKIFYDVIACDLWFGPSLPIKNPGYAYAFIGPFFQPIKVWLCFLVNRSSFLRSSFLRFLLSGDKCQTKNFEEINILIAAKLEFHATNQLCKYTLKCTILRHFNFLGILNTCYGSTRCSAV